MINVFFFLSWLNACFWFRFETICIQWIHILLFQQLQVKFEWIKKMFNEFDKFHRIPYKIQMNRIGNFIDWIVSFILLYIKMFFSLQSSPFHKLKCYFHYRSHIYFFQFSIVASNTIGHCADVSTRKYASCFTKKKKERKKDRQTEQKWKWKNYNNICYMEMNRNGARAVKMLIYFRKF